MTQAGPYMQVRTNSHADAILRARADLRPDSQWFPRPVEAEGGCGVTGFACSIPLAGRHIYEPSIQMRNRGNGKGGGVAACGLVPEDLAVSGRVLQEDYILQVALLDPDARAEVERTFVDPYFDVDQGGLVATVDDYRDVPMLQTRPPDVARYFVRVKPQALERFAAEKGLTDIPERDVEDEFVYRNSVRLNREFYSSLGSKRAFVLSHCRNLLIVKIVGYAEAAVQYYHMSDLRAHVWIAHQRYPTRGRVWHPGGAHPFVGLNEALVHNGDFANYHAVTEYLAGRNIFPQFLTDTEVSVLLFDLLDRVYKYPVEYIIEALAPTTELDFDRLPAEKRRIYRQIQAAHMHGSPDGPWFFIIARSLPQTGEYQLIGITDTAMLRPQVFALQQGEVSIGLICSEKQAIDATLAGLAAEDPRFTPIADMYKFGKPLACPPGKVHCDLSAQPTAAATDADFTAGIEHAIENNDPAGLFRYLRNSLAEMDYDQLRRFVDELVGRTADRSPGLGIEVLTLGIDRRCGTGDKKRSSVLTILRAGLERIFDHQGLCDENGPSGTHRRIDWACRERLRAPRTGETTLLIDSRGFPAEGDQCDAVLAVSAYELGWRHLVHYNTRGTRFHAAGFGPGTDGLRIDCYDNPGDYLGSGMDGLEVYVHGHGQDQLCQITKQGKLVVYGDVGQTFLYGAKGGEFYVLGSVAGRAMINAVGHPRVVINGTALEFLGESFMAGDPHNGGGFAIVNGVRFDESGTVVPLEVPYPGSNLFSLASGGAIYVRDPHRTLVDELLNGGMYRPFSAADWKLILPYLLENERLFGIEVERDLLTVAGVVRRPEDVYRKVVPRTDEEIESEMEGLGD